MIDVSTNQVYLLSFAKEDALTQWMRKLNTAMIIGPGARTSGVREPSSPYLVSKSHRSLTVMWLPPRVPYLNSVHSFQVLYCICRYYISRCCIRTVIVGIFFRRGTGTVFIVYCVHTRYCIQNRYCVQLIKQPTNQSIKQ